MKRSVEKFTCTFGEDLLLPHPNEEIEYIGGNLNIEAYKRIQRKNQRILENGFTVIKELSHIALDDLIDPSDDWLIFNRHTKSERDELKYSIMTNGLFTPLIVWEWYKGKYMILSGVERADIYRELRNEAKDEFKGIYNTIPCFVLMNEEINDVIARIIRIDSNVCVRQLDLQGRVTAICQKYMALKKLKQSRNEFNILDELSKTFNISRTTVSNYLCSLNVIEEFLYLFQEGQLSLKSIKKLSMFDAESQRKILEGIGLNNVKDFKIMAIDEEGIENQNRLEGSIRVVKDMKHPFFSTLKLKLPTKFIESVVTLLNDLIKKKPQFQMKLRVPKIKC